MEIKIVNHNSPYNANNPVCIYKKETIEINFSKSYDVAINAKKRITGIISINGETIKTGDIISSNYISTNAKSTLHFNHWKIISIENIFTPEGHFIIDISGCGFNAIVEASQDIEEQIREFIELSKIK